MIETRDWIPLVILFGAVIGARIVAERGLGRLSREQKGDVVEAFSALRQAHLFVLVGLVLVGVNWPAVGFTLVLVYFLSVGIYSFRRLNELGIPRSYGNAYALSIALQIMGFAVYLAFRPWMA